MNIFNLKKQNMQPLSSALLFTDYETGEKIIGEIKNLSLITDKLPYSIANLLEIQDEINIFEKGFLDKLGIIVVQETSIETNDLLENIRKLIDEIIYI